MWRWLASKLRRAEPERPLRFVIDDDQTFHTPVGSDERTGTHVVGVWDVTNVSNSDFVLLKVRLGDYTSRSARVGVENDRDPAYQERGPLKARRMSKVGIELTFTPAIHRAGTALIANVIFTDNYGDEHRVPSVRFRRMETGPDPAN
jgi:hypothetical protein